MVVTKEQHTSTQRSSTCVFNVMRHIVLSMLLLVLSCTRSKSEHVPDNERAAQPCTLASLSQALHDWFAIVESGEAERIGAVVDRTHFHWISMSPFAKDDTLIAVRNYDELDGYVRRASRLHERMWLTMVTPNEVRGEFLEFGPVVFERSADNLSPGRHRGIGKGEYHCGVGLTVLSLGPEPSKK